MSMDPYAPPKSGSQGGTEQPERKALREVVTAWERLRLIYNLLLLVPGVVIVTILVTGQDMPLGFAVIGALVIGIGANAAFFLGPLVELYFRALFRNGESIGRGRQLIFGAGLVVSAGVFLMALIGALA
ncbi:hypothetical protein [Haloferula sp.]|uniref:hypothetical protein n=1 Tax=Haloferula sp. TaxID=2497595 RepID=UPI003C73F781